MSKYLVMTSDRAPHKVHSLKRAVALAGGEPFIAQKILRKGKKSSTLRKYEILGVMAHCVATKEVSE